MKKTGICNLPLHYGKAPRWLFKNMVCLSEKIIEILFIEFGRKEFFKRLSDPYWFQCLGCILGFDWHSSGLTTTVCGALKEALKKIGPYYGVYSAGGKGKSGINTPEDIIDIGMKYSISGIENLILYSRLSAKVDNTALQDGFNIYHHSIFFDKDLNWAIVQQGMMNLNGERGWARRYHWLGEDVVSFVEEPHKAVCCDLKVKTLNLVAKESADIRNAIVDLTNLYPEFLLKEISQISRLNMPKNHYITIKDLNKKRLKKVFVNLYERQPKSFEELLLVKGVGPKSLRALSLISELIYGKKVSYRDPARFSFAHGGKDGTPYYVDLKTYKNSINILEKVIRKMKCDYSEKKRIFERFYKFYESFI